MAEFDLIPDSYRKLQKLRFLFKLFLIVYVFIIFLNLFCYFFLDKKLSKINSEISNIEQNILNTEQKKQYISNLENIKKSISDKLDLKKSLYDSFESEFIFTVIDESIIDGIWFNQWDYVFNNQISENISELNPMKKNSVTMKIMGQALDHSTLATLVSKISNNNNINNVEILNTSVETSDSITLVNYILSIQLRKENG